MDRGPSRCGLQFRADVDPRRVQWNYGGWALGSLLPLIVRDPLCHGAHCDGIMSCVTGCGLTMTSVLRHLASSMPFLSLCLLRSQLPTPWQRSSSTLLVSSTQLSTSRLRFQLQQQDHHCMLLFASAHTSKRCPLSSRWCRAELANRPS